MKDKEYILGEIRRVAARNAGKPVGMDRFRTETGISEHQWRGVHWARWSDALSEAGFGPLEWTTGSTVEEILEVLAILVRQYGRYPTNSEILLSKKINEAIPTPNAIRRKIGAKPETIKKLREFCHSREDLSDISPLLVSEAVLSHPENNDTATTVRGGKLKPSGYVYLVKSGRLYKIGCSENHWRRKSELHKQTSEGITEIHTIAAIDDAAGIERYWHERFNNKRTHGEWFDLSPDDIGAFKKRKFM